MKLCIYKVLKELNEGISLKPGPSSTVHGFVFPSPNLSRPHPPSFLPLFLFKHIHLLAHLWQHQLAAQAFSFHTHTDTQPQHVQRNQTHLKSVHKRGEEKNKHAAFTTKITRSSLYIQHTALTPWLHLQRPLDSCKRSSLNSLRITAEDSPHSSHYLSANHSS